LLFKFCIRSFGYLCKKDDRDPSCSGADTGTDDQLEVHTPGHHEEADEDSPYYGLPVETLFKMIRWLE